MNWLQKLWAWFDGKKTLIGTIILFGSAFVSQVLMGIWKLPAYPWEQIAMTMDWVGMAVAGLGAVHKAQKAVMTKPMD